MAPKLRSLGLSNTEYTNEFVPLLAGSELLRRLVSVDLSLGVLNSSGARQLRRMKHAFAHLQRIELGDNVLTAADRSALSATLPTVRFERDAKWRKGFKTRRYVSISE